MRVRSALVGCMLAAALPAYAGPAAFVGLSYDFGDSVGLSLKVVSTNREDRGALSAGVSYFPFSKKVGVDLGVGYVFRNGAATAGWDLLNGKAQVGIGYVNTKTKEEQPAASPTASPATPVTPVDGV